MIDTQRLISFWGKFLGFYFVLLFGFVLILAILTEVATQTVSLISREFWIGVAINVLPAIVVVFMVLLMTSRYMKTVYRLNNRREGLQFLMRYRFGQSGFRPFIKLKQGQRPTDTSILTQVGGRGSLIVGNDTAVVLEQGGRLTRVEGPGYHRLEPFEKIYAAVDLRPKRQVLPVQAMTKEGIPVTWEVEVQYQIANGTHPPNAKTPYSFSKENVFKAAICNWRREGQGGKLKDIMDWEKLVVESRTQGTLRSILAQLSLDQLIGLSETQAHDIRQSVQNELAEVLPKKVEDLGARILGVKLNKLVVEDRVTQQWIKAWQTHWQQAAALRFEESPNDTAQMIEMAKSEARMLPLTTLFRELEKQDSKQAIAFMALTYFMFRVEGRMRSEVASKLFPMENLDLPYREHSKSGISGDIKPTEFTKTDKSDQAKTVAAICEPQPTSAEVGKPSLTSVTSSNPIRRTLPIIGEVAAGKASPNLDDITGFIQQTGQMEFSVENEPLTVRLLGGKSKLNFSDDHNYIAIQVSGDSMNQAGISSGDYVILQKEKTVPVHPTSGDIVAVALRDEDNKATLKRILIDSNGVTLKPESSNSAHQPYTLSRKAFAGDNPPAAIVGLALAVLKA